VMKAPGFTAEQSLLRNSGQYMSQPYGTRLYSECCDISCIGPCTCIGGHGLCSDPHITRNGAYGREISSPLDHCRSTDGRYSCYCSCGCWASDHTCACFECPHTTQPQTILMR
jgi:hypothetical protein